jgi:protein-disulfide isomerase
MMKQILGGVAFGLFTLTVYTSFQMASYHDRGVGTFVVNESQLDKAVKLSSPEGADGQIVVLSDYSCSHCRVFYKDTLLPIVIEKKHSVIYVPTGMHSDNDIVVQSAIECAEPSDQFWLVNAVMMADNSPSEMSVKQLTNLMWPNPDADDKKVIACMMKPASLKTARESIKTNAVTFNSQVTPTLIVNGQVFLGGRTKTFLGNALNSSISK